MVQVIRTYANPYLAGYSLDRTKVYIDHRVPMEIELGGVVIPTTPPLVGHEVSEFSAEDEYGFNYKWAHEHYGTATERRIIERLGGNWDLWQKWILGLAKACEHIDGIVPDDLDLKPDHDYHDNYQIAEIRKHQRHPEIKEDQEEQELEANVRKQHEL